MSYAENISSNLDFIPGMAAIIGFISSLWLFFSSLGVILYILRAIGLSKMAKTEDIKHSWFGWIPYLNNYLVGELIGDNLWGMNNAKWILVGIQIYGSISSSLLSTMTDNHALILILLALNIVCYVYVACSFYKLCKIFQPNRATLYLVLGIIIPFLIPIFIFLMRNNTPVYDVSNDSKK